MKKNSLVSKKVLVTLVLGSMFCMSGALAKDVNVAAGQTINETVYGNDNTSISSSNTLNVTLGANSQVLNVVGGFGANASNNNVTISGSGKVDSHFTLGDGGGCVNGGLAQTGDANYNTVTFNGTVTYSSDILGGASGSGGKANENVVTINGGSFKDRIVAGSSEIQANKNRINITGGVFDICSNGEELNDIIAADEQVGSSNTASFTENSVVISGGSFSNTGAKEQRIIGAFATNGTLSKNSVNITGGTFNAPATGGMLEIYGAYSINGVVTENKVDIRNADIKYGMIAGAFSLKGEVCNNIVDIVTDHTVTLEQLTDGGIAGGVSSGGYVHHNVVNINGANITIDGAIVGGADSASVDEVAAVFTEGTGNSNIEYNEVHITNAEIAGDDEILGGSAYNGNAKNNIVEINNAVVSGDISEANDIYGADSENGNVSANKVVINNSNVKANIYGGCSENGDASKNEVNISGSGTIGTDEIADIVGGASENGKATENKVNITSTETLTIKADISGGATDDGGGIAEKNIVTISGSNIVIAGKVKGADTDTGTGLTNTGFANNNEVHLTGVTVHNKIVGGDSGGDEANYNKVIIDGGTYDETSDPGDDDNGIIGGETKKNAIGNSVEIKNANIAIDVYGGFNEEGATGTVSGNSVVIKNTSIAADYNVYGGYAGNGASVSANTVELDNVTFAGNNKVYASGKNGVTDISATDGKITVGANGLVANGALELGATDVVLKGSITGAGTVTVKAFTLDTDKSVFLNSDLSVKSNNIDIANVSKELKLQFNGTEYTATQHKDIRTGLTSLGASTVLSFINGNLKLEANEVLAVAGTLSGNDMTLSGVQPTVYTKGSGDEVEKVGAQKDMTVGIVADSSKELQTVDKVTFGSSSNVTAKDLQIKKVATEGQDFEIAVEGGSQLNLSGGDKGIVKNENDEAVKVSVSVDNDSAVSIGDIEGGTTDKKAEIGTLKVGGEVGIYNIGMNIDKLIMDGGTVVFDPAYIYVNELDFGAIGTVNVIADGTVVNVGMDKAELKAALDVAGLAPKATANNGYTVQDDKGVLAIKDAVDLSDGGKHIIVDKEGTTTDKVLQLGDGAVLVAKKVTGEETTASIKVASKDVVKISDKAQLVVSAEQYQKDGEFLKYAVVGDGSVSFDDLWTEDNVFAADPTYKLVYKDGYLTADWNTVTGIYGDKIAAPNMYDRILQKESGSEANKFLKNVINATAGAGSTDATKAAGAAALNAVTSLGELAAVNHGLYTVSNQMTDAVADHLSIMDKEETGRDVWAAYIHNKEDTDGMKLGGIEAKYDAKYNGVVVGADLVKSDKGTAGVALTYVDGDVSGTSGGVHTKNDAKYYGASIYGRIDNSNMALLGDISYMHSKGDITQYNSGVDITAKPKSDAFSVGVKAEWAVKIGESAKLVPFAGVRYMRLGTGDYENNLGMKYDVDNQNLFLAPVGVAYSGNFEMGNKNWQFKPIVEFGYTFNMGDKDTDQKVSYNGYGDTFGMDIVDSGYWFGRVGFGFSNKRTEWLLGYQYMKSENTRNNKYMVHFSFKF